MAKFNLLSDEKLIDTITQELDCGFVCYLHKETGEYTSVLDENDMMFYDMEEEFIEEQEKTMELIHQNIDDYVEFRKMSSREGYLVMQDFAETVSHRITQNKLLIALEKRKPFQNFKYVIDNSNYREDWFAYKHQRYMEYVKDIWRRETEVYDEDINDDDDDDNNNE